MNLLVHGARGIEPRVVTFTHIAARRESWDLHLQVPFDVERLAGCLILIGCMASSVGRRQLARLALCFQRGVESAWIVLRVSALDEAPLRVRHV